MGRKIVVAPQGVCAKRIEVTVSNGVVTACRIDGGCPGLSAAVCALVVGADAVRVSEVLGGIKCGSRGTSCPAEIAKAVMEA